MELTCESATRNHLESLAALAALAASLTWYFWPKGHQTLDERIVESDKFPFPPYSESRFLNTPSLSTIYR